MDATLLIPLAGAGQRFVDAGYENPKPLIPVSNTPMIEHAARAMPDTTRQVFLCRSEHLDGWPLQKTLEKYYPKCAIVPVAYLTEGQASTCLLGRDKVPMDKALHIAACDNSMVYDRARFNEFFARPDVDAVIWTFRGNPTAKVNPKMYGWVDVAKGGTKVTKVSVKVPISDTPMNDHAVVGAFSFKKAFDFFRAADEMIKQNRRIKNEFYVDEVMNLAVEQGLKVHVFEVDQYICWGTPDDLRTFEYWQSFFDQHPTHPYKKAKDPTYAR